MSQGVVERIRPESADVLQTIIEFLPSGVTLFDPDLQMVACNEELKRLLDFPLEMFEEGLPSMYQLAIFNAKRGDYGPGDPEQLAQEVVERARNMQPHVYERTRPDGTVLEIRGAPLPDGSGFVSIYTDITERKQAEQEAKRYATYLDTVLNSLPQGVTVINEHLDVVLWNKRFIDVLDLPDDLMRPGVRLEDVIRYNAERGDYGTVDPEQKVREAVDLALKFEPHRMQRTRPEGQTIDIEGRSMQIDGQVAGFITTYTDITEYKAMQDRLRQLAFYDTLTSLPNRRLLNDRLGQAMAASRRSGCHGALMFLDLDNFKPLNDTHGHVAGDALLVEAGSRLRECVREIDTVARFGGDEFVVVLGDLHEDGARSADQAQVVAEKILDTLSQPYRLSIPLEEGAEREIEHRCTTSIGVALFPDQQASQDDILKWADAAMYRAKEAGRNAIRFHQATDAA